MVPYFQAPFLSNSIPDCRGRSTRKANRQLIKETAVEAEARAARLLKKLPDEVHGWSRLPLRETAQFKLAHASNDSDWPDLGLWGDRFRLRVDVVERLAVLPAIQGKDDNAKLLYYHHTLAGHEFRRMKDWGAARNGKEQNESLIAAMKHELAARIIEWNHLRRREKHMTGLLAGKLWATAMEWSAKGLHSLWDELDVRRHGDYTRAYSQRRLLWQQVKLYN